MQPLVVLLELVYCFPDISGDLIRAGRGVLKYRKNYGRLAIDSGVAHVRVINDRYVRHVGQADSAYIIDVG